MRKIVMTRTSKHKFLRSIKNFIINIDYKDFISRGVTPVRLIIGLFFVFFGILCVQYFSNVVKNDAFLDVDMSLNEPGGVIQIWINDMVRDPLSEPAKAGRARYTFPITDRSVSFIRIDPVSTGGVEGVIHSMTIRYRNHTLQSFSPYNLAQWSIYEFSRHSIITDGFEFQSADADPKMYSNINPVAIPRPIHHWGIVLLSLYVDKGGIPIYANYKQIFWLTFYLVIVLLLVFLFGIEGNRGRSHFIIVAATFIAIRMAIVALRESSGAPPGTEQAVGYTNYYGYPKSLDYITLPILAFLPIAAAFLARLSDCLFKTTSADENIIESKTGNKSPKRKIFILFLLIPAAAIFIYCLPDMKVQLGHLKSRNFLDQWDYMNIQTWEYLFQTGALPFRDFWYPYAGRILENSGFPLGHLFQFINDTLMWFVILTATYILTDKSESKTILVFGFFFCLFMAYAFIAFSRYGIILCIALSYVAIDRDRPHIQLAHLLFWISVFLGLLGAPTTLVYTGLPIFVLLILETLFGGQSSFRTLYVRMRREFLVPLITLVVLVFFLWMNGQLEGVFSFYSELGSLSASGAIPASVERWLNMIPLLEAFVFWIPALLIGIGCYEYMKIPKGKRDLRTAKLLMIIGTASLLMLYKQITRQHMSVQIIAVPTFAVLYYLFGYRFKRNAFQFFGTCLFCGFLLVLLWNYGVQKQMVKKVLSTPSSLAVIWKTMLMDTDERNRLRKSFFSLEHFKNLPEVMALYDAVGDQMDKEKRRSLFVLSDYSVLYIATDQIPPFYTNLYNASGLTDQKRLVRCLQKYKPGVVVWDPAWKGIDKVPPLSRNPIVFESVINDFVPDKKVGRFWLLRRRSPDEPIDIPYWRSTLGNTFSMGYIPNYMNIKHLEPCDGVSDGCEDYLVVRLKEPGKMKLVEMIHEEKRRPAGRNRLPTPAAMEISVQIIVEGEEFIVRFQASDPDKEYKIPLKRVWFWQASLQSDNKPILGESGPDFDAVIVKQSSNKEFLY